MALDQVHVYNFVGFSILFSAWMVFFLFFSSRLIAALISFLLNHLVFHRNVLIDIKGIHFAVLRGCISVREIKISTPNMNFRAVSGYLSIAWWRVWASEGTMVVLNLCGLECSLINNTAKYDILEELLGRTRNETVEVEENLPPRAPGIFWLARVIGIRINTGAITIGNPSLPTVVILGFEVAKGKLCLHQNKKLCSRVELDMQLLDAKVKVCENEGFQEDFCRAGDPRRSVLPNLFSWEASHVWHGMVAGFKDAFPFLQHVSDGNDNVSECGRSAADPGENEEQGRADVGAQSGTNSSGRVKAKEGIEEILSSQLIHLKFYDHLAGFRQEATDPLEFCGMEHVQDLERGLKLSVVHPKIVYGPWEDRQREMLQNFYFPFDYQDRRSRTMKSGYTSERCGFRTRVEIRGSVRFRLPFSREASVRKVDARSSYARFLEADAYLKFSSGKAKEDGRSCAPDMFETLGRRGKQDEEGPEGARMTGRAQEEEEAMSGGTPSDLEGLEQDGTSSSETTETSFEKSEDGSTEEEEEDFLFRSLMPGDAADAFPLVAVVSSFVPFHLSSQSTHENTTEVEIVDDVSISSSIVSNKARNVFWSASSFKLSISVLSGKRYNDLRTMVWRVTSVNSRVNLLRDHDRLIASLISDWTWRPPDLKARVDPVRFVPRIVHVFVEMQEKLEVCLVVNEDNVVNDFADDENNATLVLRAETLRAETRTCNDVLQALKGETQYVVSVENLAGTMKEETPRSSISQFISGPLPEFLRGRSLKVSGSVLRHRWNGKSYADVDNSSIYIDADGVVLFAHGHSRLTISNFINNYFGSCSFSVTRKEFNATKDKNGIWGWNHKQQKTFLKQFLRKHGERIPNKNETFLRINLCNVSLDLPEHEIITATKQSFATAHVNEVIMEIRNQTQESDLVLSVSPISFRFRTGSDKADKSRTAGPAGAMRIDGFQLHHRKLMGSYPMQQVYHISSKISCGRCDGELSPAQFQALASFVQQLFPSDRRRLNIESDVVPGRLWQRNLSYDVLDCEVDGISLVLSDPSYKIQLEVPQGVQIQGNSLISTDHHAATMIQIPTCRVVLCDAAKDPLYVFNTFLPNRSCNANTLCYELGRLQTSLAIRLFKRFSNAGEDAENQLHFLVENDRATGRLVDVVEKERQKLGLRYKNAAVSERSFSKTPSSELFTTAADFITADDATSLSTTESSMIDSDDDFCEVSDTFAEREEFSGLVSTSYELLPVHFACSRAKKKAEMVRIAKLKLYTPFHPKSFTTFDQNEFDRVRVEFVEDYDRKLDELLAEKEIRSSGWKVLQFEHPETQGGMREELFVEDEVFLSAGLVQVSVCDIALLKLLSLAENLPHLTSSVEGCLSRMKRANSPAPVSYAFSALHEKRKKVVVKVDGAELKLFKLSEDEVPKPEQGDLRSKRRKNNEFEQEEVLSKLVLAVGFKTIRCKVDLSEMKDPFLQHANLTGEQNGETKRAKKVCVDFSLRKLLCFFCMQGYNRSFLNEKLGLPKGIIHKVSGESFLRAEDDESLRQLLILSVDGMTLKLSKALVADVSNVNDWHLRVGTLLAAMDQTCVASLLPFLAMYLEIITRLQDHLEQRRAVMKRNIGMLVDQAIPDCVRTSQLTRTSSFHSFSTDSSPDLPNLNLAHLRRSKSDDPRNWQPGRKKSPHAIKSLQRHTSEDQYRLASQLSKKVSYSSVVTFVRACSGNDIRELNSCLKLPQSWEFVSPQTLSAVCGACKLDDLEDDKGFAGWSSVVSAEFPRLTLLALPPGCSLHEPKEEVHALDLSDMSASESFRKRHEISCLQVLDTKVTLNGSIASQQTAAKGKVPSSLAANKSGDVNLSANVNCQKINVHIFPLFSQLADTIAAVSRRGGRRFASAVISSYLEKEAQVVKSSRRNVSFKENIVEWKEDQEQDKRDVCVVLPIQGVLKRVEMSKSSKKEPMTFAAALSTQGNKKCLRGRTLAGHGRSNSLPSFSAVENALAISNMLCDLMARENEPGAKPPSKRNSKIHVYFHLDVEVCAELPRVGRLMLLTSPISLLLTDVGNAREQLGKRFKAGVSGQIKTIQIKVEKNANEGYTPLGSIACKDFNISVKTCAVSPSRQPAQSKAGMDVKNLQETMRAAVKEQRHEETGGVLDVRQLDVLDISLNKVDGDLLQKLVYAWIPPSKNLEGSSVRTGLDAGASKGRSSVLELVLRVQSMRASISMLKDVTVSYLVANGMSCTWRRYIVCDGKGGLLGQGPLQEHSLITIKVHKGKLTSARRGRHKDRHPAFALPEVHLVTEAFTNNGRAGLDAASLKKPGRVLEQQRPAVSEIKLLVSVEQVCNEVRAEILNHLLEIQRTMKHELDVFIQEAEKYAKRYSTSSQPHSLLSQVNVHVTFVMMGIRLRVVAPSASLMVDTGLISVQAEVKPSSHPSRSSTWKVALDGFTVAMTSTKMNAASAAAREVNASGPRKKNWIQAQMTTNLRVQNFASDSKLSTGMQQDLVAWLPSQADRGHNTPHKLSIFIRNTTLVAHPGCMRTFVELGDHYVEAYKAYEEQRRAIHLEDLDMWIKRMVSRGKTAAGSRLMNSNHSSLMNNIYLHVELRETLISMVYAYEISNDFCFTVDSKAKASEYFQSFSSMRHQQQKDRLGLHDARSLIACLHMIDLSAESSSSSSPFNRMVVSHLDFQNLAVGFSSGKLKLADSLHSYDHLRKLLSANGFILKEASGDFSLIAKQPTEGAYEELEACLVMSLPSFEIELDSQTVESFFQLQNSWRIHTAFDSPYPQHSPDLEGVDEQQAAAAERSEGSKMRLGDLKSEKRFRCVNLNLSLHSATGILTIYHKAGSELRSRHKLAPKKAAGAEESDILLCVPFPEFDIAACGKFFFTMNGFSTKAESDRSQIPWRWKGNSQIEIDGAVFSLPDSLIVCELRMPRDKLGNPRELWFSPLVLDFLNEAFALHSQYASWMQSSKASLPLAATSEARSARSGGKGREQGAVKMLMNRTVYSMRFASFDVRLSAVETGTPELTHRDLFAVLSIQKLDLTSCFSSREQLREASMQLADGTWRYFCLHVDRVMFKLVQSQVDSSTSRKEGSTQDSYIAVEHFSASATSFENDTQLLTSFIATLNSIEGRMNIRSIFNASPLLESWLTSARNMSFPQKTGASPAQHRSFISRVKELKKSSFRLSVHVKACSISVEHPLGHATLSNKFDGGRARPITFYFDKGAMRHDQSVLPNQDGIASCTLGESLLLS
eukprot:768392-Hanusia_phi.AAC.18